MLVRWLGWPQYVISGSVVDFERCLSRFLRVTCNRGFEVCLRRLSHSLRIPRDYALHYGCGGIRRARINFTLVADEGNAGMDAL